MKGVWLEDLTWPEAKEWFDRGAVVVLPIGAASKEHGHHLPLCTDYLLARAMAERLAAVLPVVVAPILPFGYYPAFRHYPGSQHLSPETFSALLKDLLGGFIDQGVRNLAVLNTGVSTEPLVNVQLRELYETTGVRIAGAHISNLGRAADVLFEQKLGGHGDEHETAMIMAIDPARLRAEKAVPDYGNMIEAPKTVFYLPAVFSGEAGAGIDFSQTGVRGDPTLATREKGEEALDAITADLVDGLRALFPDAVSISS
ncbi:creatininase family protein [Pelagibius litoralis]|uniref:Creatininase family protein n=1 Tax=Pelagibius litoralis TaxID=374515 RepID=A0A967EUX9_9PROT|nr:creatininase family protein [Pelagibius litoralis]NIA67881.1 creatininase family protein [Pelagibius litoralis]